MVFRTDIFRKLSLGAPDTWLSQIWSKVFSSNNMQLWVTKYCWALSLTTRYSNDNTKCYPIKQCIGMTNTKTEQNFNPGSKLIVLEPDPWSVNNIDVNYLIIHWINCCCCCWLFVESVMGPGARFSKVPIINGPGKLLPFTLKTGVSVVLHLTW